MGKEKRHRNEPLDLLTTDMQRCMIKRPAWNVLEEKIERGIDYMKNRKRRRVPQGEVRKEWSGDEQCYSGN